MDISPKNNKGMKSFKLLQVPCKFDRLQGKSMQQMSPIILRDMRRSQVLVNISVFM